MEQNSCETYKFLRALVVKQTENGSEEEENFSN